MTSADLIAFSSGKLGEGAGFCCGFFPHGLVGGILISAGEFSGR